MDTVEEWNIINTTADTHPIHLHLIGFQVAERQAFDFPAYLVATYGADELKEENVGSGDWPYEAPDDFLQGDVLPRGDFEAGWKDTVQVHPGQVTRLLVPSAHRPPLACRSARSTRQTRSPGLPVALPHPRPRGQRHDAAVQGHPQAHAVTPPM